MQVFLILFLDYFTINQILSIRFLCRTHVNIQKQRTLSVSVLCFYAVFIKYQAAIATLNEFVATPTRHRRG